MRALASTWLLALASCVTDGWVPPVDACVGPRCAPIDASVDASVVDAVADVAPEASVRSCVGVPVRALVSGYYDFTCALRCDGTVWCWGSNAFGQLGDGTRTSRAIPVAVRDLGGGATAIAAGFSHACAVVQGTVRCWGDNANAQLGSGNREVSSGTVAVVGLGRPAVAVAAGGEHTCALVEGGSVWCWGNNPQGAIGDGSYLLRTMPAEVRSLDGPAVDIIAGQYHTCARLEGGGVRCWGLNMFGALGDGTVINRTLPVPVELARGATAISSRSNHTCARLEGGELWCWGYNADGGVGDGTLVQRTRPTRVPIVGDSVLGVSVGDQHTCAWSDGGGLQCWGANSRGQLGDGSTRRRLMPTVVEGIGGSVVLAAAGNTHTCVALADGRVRCWGSGTDGQLGSGTNDDQATPVTTLLPR